MPEIGQSGKHGTVSIINAAKQTADSVAEQDHAFRRWRLLVGPEGVNSAGGEKVLRSPPAIPANICRLNREGEEESLGAEMVAKVCDELRREKVKQEMGGSQRPSKTWSG